MGGKIMNRSDVYRQSHGISFAQKVGQAQNLFLAGAQNRLGAAGAWTQTAEAQRPCLLQTFTVSAQLAGVQCEGTITEITIAGQSGMVSDQSCCIEAFAPTSYNASARSLGISVDNNMKVVVQGTILNTGGNVSLAIALDPIPESAVKTRAQQAQAYNFVFGLGTTNILAGATGSLKARSNRAVTLGELTLQNLTAAGAAFVNNDDIILTSCLVGGLEMLNGVTGTQEISLDAFIAQASDPLLSFSYPINPQTEVELKFTNVGANPCDIGGAIFCEPWTAAMAKRAIAARDRC